MRAVEDGTSFGLRARQTGEVIETVDARELFEKISEAAWACADPGLQYDDTINDWHTNPETGRITASNPCFPADQRVVTDQGLVRIGDLVSRAAEGERFDIYTHDVTSQTEAVDRIVATRTLRYMVTGTKEILELRFSDGSRLRCTPNHRLWTANRGWVRAEDLEPRDRVAKSLHFARSFDGSGRSARGRPSGRHAARPRSVSRRSGTRTSPTSSAGSSVTAALLTTRSPSSSVPRPTVPDVMPAPPGAPATLDSFDAKPSLQANGTLQLRSGERDVVAFFRALGVSSAPRMREGRPGVDLRGPRRGRDRVPAQALFDADGCAVDDEVKGTRYVGLGSRSEELLLGVQELLASLGIAARIYETGTKADVLHLHAQGRLRRFVRLGRALATTCASAVDRCASSRALIDFSMPAKNERLIHVVDYHRSYPTDETVALVSRESRGFETTYNLTEPRNHSYIVSGVVVANCSEYMSLDNSSCNLASLNLLKFLKDDDTFDAERFAKAVEVVITAMDISICFADFPTEAIGETTRDYRQLGIGYANLGALLMAMGLGYDSDGGRTMAAAITSLMTGQSYKRSAELAAIVGPYAGYARNAEAHKRVMRKHQAANDTVRPLTTPTPRSTGWRRRCGPTYRTSARANGFRNAQASVLAPTGTIGFMMDCDTTGIEPDFSLVKFKKLVGGGSMQIVNQTIPRALRKLGYQSEQRRGDRRATSPSTVT